MRFHALGGGGVGGGFALVRNVRKEEVIPEVTR